MSAGARRLVGWTAAFLISSTFWLLLVFGASSLAQALTGRP